MSGTWWWLGGASFSFAWGIQRGCHTGISDALGGFESVAIGDSGQPDLNTVDQLRAPIAYSLYKGTEF